MINERYLIKKKLGEGRSKVFLCNDVENPSEDIAVKILSNKADEVEIENFRNEFITLRRLNHPGIVQALDFGTIVKNHSSEDNIISGSKYFTLEYFNGKPLLEYKDINEESLKKIITQICAAIFYLHQSDYIYYDLKPDNILVKKLNEEPIVKLIDLGFAQKLDFKQENQKSNDNKYIRGTAEYIAPELLKNEEHDNRVDLYSLGMILYRIVYKKFPFNSNDELKIYKAHLEQDFEYEKSRYSNSLINVIKKLLNKDPENRYNNSLEVLYDLDISINNKITKDWNPAWIFVNRRDVLNILDRYINDKSSSEIFTIKGFEGSGKTALSEEVNFIHKNSVLIKYDKSKSGYRFLKYFLKEMIFNDFIYSNISSETKSNVENLLKNPSAELIDELKGIFAKVTQGSNFILILDDFNSYDNFTLEMIKDVLPIFQVNKIKIVVTEDSDFDYTSNSFQNVKEINLTPFTDVQVMELIEKSYNNFFPKEELKKIILLYADLLPGSIEGFIRDCLQLNIIQYKREQITIDVSEEKAKLLKSSHDQIYEARLSYLTNDGINAAKILSLFNLNLDENILSDLLELDINKTSLIVVELRENNILHSSNIGTKLLFTSEGLKKHIYANFKKKKEYHLDAGNILKTKLPDFDRNELARQFELGEDYNTCYEILKEEIKDAEKMSAYTYQKNILIKLISLPLSEEYKNEIKFLLSEVLLKLSDYKSALNLIEELTEKKLSKKISDELVILKGTCLIELGEYQKGQQLLKSVLNSIKDEIKKNKLLVSIAYSNFDLKKYDDAKIICSEIINSKNSTTEDIGKCYNLLGMIEIYQNNNMDNALEKFNDALTFYKKENLKRRIAGMEVNLGGIYTMKNEYSKAEVFWNSALKNNLSIGNIEQEAKILLNYGAYFYFNLNFNSAISQYNRAYDIFLSLGDINGQGLVLNNLGETYLIICEYEKCYASLTKAKQIFEEINNIEEKIEALFSLGKFYFTVGDKVQLKTTAKECLIIEKQYTLGIKYKNYISYLTLISSFNDESILNSLDQLTAIAEVFFQLGDINNFVRTLFIQAEILIFFNSFDKAISVLNNKNLLEKCKSFSFFKAERLFLLAKISIYDTASTDYSAIYMFEKSLNLIKEEIITELTWKILLEIAEYYSNRGNYTKAKDYIAYAKSVISYISEKIGDVKLRKIYLNSIDRKKALERLKFLELQKIE